MTLKQLLTKCDANKVFAEAAKRTSLDYDDFEEVALKLLCAVGTNEEDEELGILQTVLVDSSVISFLILNNPNGGVNNYMLHEAPVIKAMKSPIRICVDKDSESPSLRTLEETPDETAFLACSGVLADLVLSVCKTIKDHSEKAKGKILDKIKKTND